MRRRGILAVMVLALMATALPAGAVIHEIVAAYCSGGDVGVIDANGELLPPPLIPPPGPAFAQPVSVNGAVDFADGNPANFTIGSSPSAKWDEGTPLGALDLADPDHESENCAALQP